MICWTIAMAPPPPAFLYSPKPSGRRGLPWHLLHGVCPASLKECGLAVVELPEAVQRLLQDGPRGALVRDHLLEVFIFLLTVLARLLHLELHVGDLLDHALLLFGERLLIRVELVDLGLKILLDLVLLRGLLVVFV